MTEGIQKAKGGSFPSGSSILPGGEENEAARPLLGAVKEKYRGMGLDVLMGGKMLHRARRRARKFLDTHHEMETNVKVRAEMERMGGKIYKKFRVYQKALCKGRARLSKDSGTSRRQGARR